MEGSLQQVALGDLGETIGTPPSSRLIDSVKRNGVMQPAMVARTVDDDGEIRLELIDGNRRVAAARIARITHIPAIVLDGLTSGQIAEWTLAANGFRNANYLTEFMALQELKQSRYSADEIHTVSGMAKSSLDVRNRLQGLIPELLDALRQGRITQADAVTASKLHSEDQATLNEHLNRTGHLRRADILKMFPELASKSSDTDDSEMQQPTMSTLQNLLLETVSIAGRLELDSERFLKMAADTWDANNPHMG